MPGGIVLSIFRERRIDTASKGLDRLLGRQVANFLGRRVDIVVTVSRSWSNRVLPFGRPGRQFQRADIVSFNESPDNRRPTRESARFGIQGDESRRRLDKVSLPQATAEMPVRRIVYVGPLVPEAGLTDVVDVLADWSEARPRQQIEMILCGEGCLKGLLLAQPLPSNLRMSFPGAVPPADIAHCDLLMVPQYSAQFTRRMGNVMRNDESICLIATDPLDGPALVRRYLVTPVEPAELVKALNSVLESDVTPESGPDLFFRSE